MAGDSADSCPDHEIALLVAGELPPAAAAALRRHVEGCSSCRQVLANLGRDAPSAEASTAHGATAPAILRAALEPPPGTRFDHFVVERTLGRGGMGVVLAARDETLDRVVAIKIVRPQLFRSRPHRDATARLLREARAMARISHPNVITIHAVGTVDDNVYLAMEYIEGGTLRDWADDKRGWSAITSVYVAAGRGLAAAHAAGLVHRDFKPGNVLVDRDDRVYVTDFGLVYEGDESSSDTGSSSTGGRVESSLTRTGEVLGTPRYMAPEQFKRGKVDQRTDQFSYCVSLWEALVGTPPFGIGEYADLEARVCAGEILAPPSSAQVPSRVLRALRRGMSPNASERWPNMEMLLGELEAALAARRRWRWLLVGGLALAGVLGAGYRAGAWGTATPADPCHRDESADWAGTWDEGSRASVQTLIEASEVPFVRQSWPRLAAALDAHTRQWSAARTEACRAAHVTGEVTPSIHSRRLACLEDRRREVRELVRLIRDGDPDLLLASLPAASALRPPSDCDDLDRIAAHPAPPSEDADRIEAARAAIASASLLKQAGQQEQCTKVLAPWIEGVAGVEHVATRARMHRLHASCVAAMNGERGLELLRGAYSRVVESGIAELEYETALDLAALFLDDDRENAAFWLDVADSAARRAAMEPGFRWHTYRAMAATDLVEAQAHYEEAVQRAESRARLATSHGNLGAFLAEQKRHDEAREHLLHAMEAAESHYGPDHPKTLKWRANLLVIDIMRGRYADVVEAAPAVIEAQDRAFGERTLETANTVETLGLALLRLHRTADAKRRIEEALEIRRRQLGPRHPSISAALENLARVEAEAGRKEVALTRATEAAAINREALGDGHARTLSAQTLVASVLSQSGRHAEAVSTLEAVLAATTDAPDTDPVVYDALSELGRAQFRSGQPSAAAATLLRCRNATKARRPSPRIAASNLLWLARARHRSDPKSSVEALLAEAEAVLLEVDDKGAPQLALIRCFRDDPDNPDC